MLNVAICVLALSIASILFLWYKRRTEWLEQQQAMSGGRTTTVTTCSVNAAMLQSKANVMAAYGPFIPGTVLGPIQHSNIHLISQRGRMIEEVDFVEYRRTNESFAILSDSANSSVDSEAQSFRYTEFMAARRSMS